MKDLEIVYKRKRKPNIDKNTVKFCHFEYRYMLITKPVIGPSSLFQACD